MAAQWFLLCRWSNCTVNHSLRETSSSFCLHESSAAVSVYEAKMCVYVWVVRPWPWLQSLMEEAVLWMTQTPPAVQWYVAAHKACLSPTLVSGSGTPPHPATARPFLTLWNSRVLVPTRSTVWVVVCIYAAEVDWGADCWWQVTLRSVPPTPPD